jgi:hypothetical protein
VSGGIPTAADFEEMAARQMRDLGYADATVTGGGSDGGIDVLSTNAVAQVKAHMKPVGRPDIQRLHGVSTQSRRAGLFFSLQGYTPQAEDYATSAGIALFKFTDFNGSIVAVNAPASAMITRWRETSQRATSLPYRDGVAKLAKLRESNLKRIAEDERRERVRHLPPPPPPTKRPRRVRRWFGRGSARP